MAQLEIDNLSVEFRTRHGVVRALDSVSLSVTRGEIVGVVGESGSGKSVTAYTVMGLTDEAAQITKGNITMGGIDLLAARPEAMRELRGREMAMIFQSPRTALNPIRKVGKQIEDVLQEHAGLPSRDLRKAAIAALARVRIPDPERRAEAYPFELSGGMCQRVMIAMALACSPALLVADEPTTGLDVTTQAVIMDLVADLARRQGMASLLITHDLGLAMDYCDNIAVMHAGHIVEIAPAATLFRAPCHPYTQKLIAATPRPNARLADLLAIPGGLPDLQRNDLPPCRYSARCERRGKDCDTLLRIVDLGAGHRVACQYPL